ncbi:methyltransferase-like protein 6 [Salpingoeca rosetta]|uniref:Methyltransferase-like protein 6 n=1 Tax=Salpingoeca rosetta (strain ATCC 50818 / BSB-021) TaxID=946362 RepID=F2TZT4_SALR5|nr:methyltransferase-like protein 6 [Salpingoeca rosetta]EGD80662.1 methyltransferase-like protein 6 [Salpingoeca rosetta]|eukprot:XP_004997223.1 methyltransferase-like protein 6 [Salpingoeca rosetta]
MMSDDSTTTAEGAGGELIVRSTEIVDLNQEVKQRVETEPCARPYLSVKFAKEAKRHWDLFYKRNTVNFFKDRHWLTREFPVLMQETNPQGERPVHLEIGCGVGNTVFPLRKENPRLFVHACDLSPRAVNFVKGHEEFTEEDCHAFQCDLTRDDVLEHMEPESCDTITALFVLSAMSIDEMRLLLANVVKVLKAGGAVCFRDYGIYDHAMLRFKKGHKLAPQLYYRQDGTRAFYFELEQTRALFKEFGLEADDLAYVSRRTINKKEGVDLARVFVQGTFVKQRQQQAGDGDDDDSADGADAAVHGSGDANDASDHAGKADGAADD